MKGGWISKRCAALLCGWLLLLVSAVAGAGDLVGGSIGVTSDYVYRGVSHSRGHPAAQGDLRLRLGGNTQIGVWASTLDHKYADDEFQVDGFLSYRFDITPEWQMRVQYTHSAFVNDRSPLGYDYDELAASIAYQMRISLTAAWIPNAARYRYWGGPIRDDAYAYDAAWLEPLFSIWHASLGIGYYDVSSLYGTGYAYWHVGIVGAAGPFGIEALWIDTQERAAYMAGGAYSEEIVGGRWSAAVRWRF